MKLKLTKKNIFLLVIIAISISITIYGLVNIAIWYWDYYKIMQETNEIEKSTIVTEVADNEQKEGNELSNSDSNIEKMKYLEVDFTNLIKTNEEVVAWIYVAGTNINYPIVQHSNNEYYLDHTFNGSKNGAGWIFMDYHNNVENIDKNTIIYGHNRKDGSMFGSLKNILNEEWYTDESNNIIKTSTKNENSIWQIFSMYTIPVTDDYLQIKFKNDDIFLKFLNKIKKRSIYDFETELNESDKILTLSTCHGENMRFVVHAKLIKSQDR